MGEIARSQPAQNVSIAAQEIDSFSIHENYRVQKIKCRVVACE
jgi:hypothetical protein